MRPADFVCLVMLVFILPLSPPVLSVVAPCTMVLVPSSSTTKRFKLLRLAVAIGAFAYAIHGISTRTKHETSTVLLTLAAAAALDVKYF